MPRLNMKRQLEDLGFSDASVLLGPGVYALGYNDEIVWVGQSQTLARRIGEHIDERKFAFNSIYFLPVHLADVLAVESFLILKLNPRYNSRSPFELYHRAKRGLVGEYSQADKRRLNLIMGHLGFSYEELLNGVDWNEENVS